MLRPLVLLFAVAIAAVPAPPAAAQQPRRTPPARRRPPPVTAPRIPTPRSVLGFEPGDDRKRSEEHTSELQSPCNLVCRLLLEKKKKQQQANSYCMKDKRNKISDLLLVYSFICLS